jgi:hypothetical protein
MSVPGGKLTEGQILALKGVETLTCLETIKLLFLVANSVVFYYDTASKVAQKFKLELATLHWDSRVEVITVKSLAFVENLFVLVHTFYERGHITSANLVDLFFENLGITSHLGTIAIEGDNQIVAKSGVLL